MVDRFVRRRIRASFYADFASVVLVDPLIFCSRMDAQKFKKELDKYSTVKRADWVRPRHANNRGHKTQPVPREPTNAVISSLEKENDFFTLVDKASSKLLDRKTHTKFMSALRTEQSQISRIVNLEILEDFAAKELQA